MKMALRLVAVALIGLGAVWVLQGLNVLPGSVMSGQIRWAYGGGCCVVAGVAVFFLLGRDRSGS